MVEDPTVSEQRMRELDELRRDAMVDGSTEILGELLHDNLTYTHSDGTCDSKASYLRRLSSRSLRYTELICEIESVTTTADTAIVTGLMEASVQSHGRPVELRTRTLSVWLLDGQNWRLFAFQATSRDLLVAGSTTDTQAQPGESEVGVSGLETSG